MDSDGYPFSSLYEYLLQIYLLLTTVKGGSHHIIHDHFVGKYGTPDRNKWTLLLSEWTQRVSAYQN